MITDELLSRIHSDLKKTLKELNISYKIRVLQDDQFSFRLEISGNDESKSKEIQSANLKISKRYGFPQNIVGMEFSTSDRHYKIIGFKTSNRLYPVLAEDIINGTRYKFSVNSVKEKLGGDKLINRNVNLDNLLG
jgi:hypothetical protein